MESRRISPSGDRGHSWRHKNAYKIKSMRWLWRNVFTNIYSLVNKRKIIYYIHLIKAHKLRSMYIKFRIPPPRQTTLKIKKNMNDKLWISTLPKSYLRLCLNIEDNKMAMQYHRFWLSLNECLKNIFPSFSSSFSKNDVTFGLLLKNTNYELCVHVVLLSHIFIHKNRKQ